MGRNKIDTQSNNLEILTGLKEQEAIKWFEKTAKVAEKALCLRAKCGAIVVKRGRIMGQGYNAPPLNREDNRKCKIKFIPGKPKYDKTCCMHAEWRAILYAINVNYETLYGAKLYFTRVDKKGNIIKSGEPFCTTCSRMALDVGIDKFVLWQEEGIKEFPTHLYNDLSYKYKLTTVDEF